MPSNDKPPAVIASKTPTTSEVAPSSSLTNAAITSKKRKALQTSGDMGVQKINGTSTNNKKGKTDTHDETDTHDDYKPLSLDQICSSVLELCKRVPPPVIDPDDDEAIRKWAEQMQAVVEEFNLLLCCVSSATYKWGSERSGAADQNLSLLSAELSSAQDSISTSVTPRLTNILAPVVDLVVAKVVTTKEDDKEIKTNVFTREIVDPEFSKLCGNVLSRNAKMLRQVVLASFHRVEQVVKDYQKASKKDNQQDRSFTY